MFVFVCMSTRSLLRKLWGHFQITHLHIKNPTRNRKARNNSDQFGSVSSEHRAAKVSKNPGGELEACKLPLLPPFFTINCKYSLAKKISKDVLVTLTFGILIEIGFQNMFDVLWVDRVNFALFQGKKPESRILGGNFGLVVVERVEVEELVENSAFHRWVCWIVDGLACAELEYQKREN